MGKIALSVSLAALLISLAAPHLNALDNGLALTPPMGWISWVRFTCETDCTLYPATCINSKLYEDMAYLLEMSGLSEVGYKYVNIDDCWSELARETTTGRLIANSTRFPKGIDGLAREVQARKLKLGIYGDCGTLTCANYPAQLKTLENMEDNYFELDATTFADWQVDSFKFDGCNIEPDRAESICPRMADALKRAGRPILLTCEWPFYQNRESKSLTTNWTLVAESCNMWRYYEDVEDSWLSVLAIVDYTVNIQDIAVQYHGPGAWFDPDQLVVGDFGLSQDQERTHMAIWSLWSAPLFMSNDLRNIAPDSIRLLKDKALIAINQDPLGVLAYEVGRTHIKPDNIKVMAFVKPIRPFSSSGCPSYAILYVNRNTLGDSQLISFKLPDLIANAKPAIEVALKRAKSPKSAAECIKLFTDWSPEVELYEQSSLIDRPGYWPPKTTNLGKKRTLILMVNPSGASGVVINANRGK